MSIFEYQPISKDDFDNINSNLQHHGIERSSNNNNIDTQLFDLKNWISKVRSPLHRINITNRGHLSWMKKAASISSQTGEFSSEFDDDLQSFLDEYETAFEPIFNPAMPYFVRGEHATLKYGQHGLGPYWGMRRIIESTLSCLEGHTILSGDSDEITLYLYPWVSISPSHEYRVFVSNDRLTAISQLDTTQCLNVGDHIANDVTIIQDYFTNYVRTFAPTLSYIYDFAVLDDGTPYFLQFYPFRPMGPNSIEISCSAALFDWTVDRALLMERRKVGEGEGEEEAGEDNKVYVRYIV